MTKKQAAQAEAAQAEPAQAEGFVKMTRDPGQFPPPHAADVHPAEVDNYAQGGWTVKEA